jgi:hypothetical protein
MLYAIQRALDELGPFPSFKDLVRFSRDYWDGIKVLPKIDRRWLKFSGEMELFSDDTTLGEISIVTECMCLINLSGSTIWVVLNRVMTAHPGYVTYKGMINMIAACARAGCRKFGFKNFGEVYDLNLSSVTKIAADLLTIPPLIGEYEITCTGSACLGLLLPLFGHVSKLTLLSDDLNGSDSSDVITMGMGLWTRAAVMRYNPDTVRIKIDQLDYADQYPDQQRVEVLNLIEEVLNHWKVWRKYIHRVFIDTGLSLKSGVENDDEFEDLYDTLLKQAMDFPPDKRIQVEILNIKNGSSGDAKRPLGPLINAIFVQKT